MQNQQFTEVEMNNAFEEYILNMDKLQLFSVMDHEITEMIFARKNLLNEHFEFTPEEKEKIKRLNVQFKQITKKAHHECLRLDKLMKVWAKEENCFHNDYEIRAHLDVFCNQKHKGTPLEGYSLVNEFTISFNGKYLETDPDPIHIDADNWNLQTQDPALNDLNFSYPFYCLTNHAHYLSWPDIIAIDFIWMEVKLTLQKMEDINNGGKQPHHELA